MGTANFKWGQNPIIANFDFNLYYAGDISLPSIPNPIDLERLIKNIPKIEVAFPTIEPAIDNMLYKFDEIKQDTRYTLALVKHKIVDHMVDFNKIPGFMPHDYNPPKYIGPSKNITNIDEETELHHNVTKVS